MSSKFEVWPEPDCAGKCTSIQSKMLNCIVSYNNTINMSDVFNNKLRDEIAEDLVHYANLDRISKDLKSMPADHKLVLEYLHSYISDLEYDVAEYIYDVVQKLSVNECLEQINKYLGSDLVDEITNDGYCYGYRSAVSSYDDIVNGDLSDSDVIAAIREIIYIAYRERFYIDFLDDVIDKWIELVIDTVATPYQIADYHAAKGRL